ncbi:DUF418 domain-containing protein [Flindersiella endophytica]
MRSTRIVALDILRGVAIIGTLGTNIWIFTDPQGPVGFMSNLPDPSTFTGAAESLLRSAANGKFLGLLTLMFGIGLELQYRSAQRRGQKWPGWYLWRAGLLFAEGLLHYVLIFEFDVLMGYAVTSMLVAYLIGRSDRAIRTWMITVGSIHVALICLLTVGLVLAPRSAQQAFASDPTTLFSDGTWLDQVTNRLVNWMAFRIEAVFIVPSGIVLFLLGAKLLRGGLFETTARGTQLRNRLMAIGLGVAAPLTVLTSLGGPEWFFLERYVLAPVVALGLLGLVPAIVLRLREQPGLLRTGLNNIGRTALSCYVFQNLVASILCYGWGFGLAVRFESLRPWWAVGAMVFISTLFMAASSLWLRRFSRGPLEWVWHWAYTLPQRRREREPVAAG